MGAKRALDILYVGMLPPHPGGSGISWSQLLGGFVRRGHTVRSVAPITADALAAGDTFATAHPELDVTRFVVPHFYTGPNVPASAEYRALEHVEIERAMTALIADQRPDVVISGRETFALHVPDLVNEHLLPCVQGIRGNTTIAILNGTYPPELADQLLDQFRKADLLVSPARHMADGLRTLGFDNIEIVANAVDLELFTPGPADVSLRRQLDIDDDEVVVVHASNLKTVKRPLDLVASAVIALEHDPHLVYVIVGDGAHRLEMETACRERGIAQRFRFLGWIDYEQIPRYLRLADVVVSCSATEGLSRVYLETQASGRLLLASDIPAAREVVDDGESGLLFAKGNVSALAHRTLEVARSPALRSRIGRQARERVQAHSLAMAVDAYVDLLHDCARRREAARHVGR